MYPTLIIAMALLAQSPSQKPPAKDEPARLTGCVSSKPAQDGDYTFTDTGNGSQYRLTGKDIKKYAGKKVEVVESSSKRFAIKGGLYPSPNVAAQAGALDPAQAAIATQPGSGAATGTGSPLPEFRAQRVRAVEGTCE
jgi:hypothetical protein